MKYHQLTRIFIKEALHEYVELDNQPDIHYLSKVMRKKKSDKIIVFNNISGEFIAQIIDLSSKKINLKLLEKIRDSESEQQINLIFAPIKQTRIGFLLEKATELGVTNLFPIQTKHSVVDKLNINKWQNYVKEAAEQCGRLSIPEISPMQSLDYFLRNWDVSKSVLWCNEREKNLFFPQVEREDCAYSILLGPEGGFSDNEHILLQNTIFIKSVHLGKRILRAETAAIVALSYANL